MAGRISPFVIPYGTGWPHVGSMALPRGPCWLHTTESSASRDGRIGVRSASKLQLSPGQRIFLSDKSDNDALNDALRALQSC